MTDLRITTLVLSALAFGSCDATPPYDRAAMLASLTDVVIAPGYAALAADSGALSEATQRLCADLDAPALEAARTAWRAARARYKHTEAFGVGPAMDLRAEGELDFWPTRPTNIELAVQSGDALDSAYFDAAGVSIKGLPALEYLLFEPSLDDEALVQAFVDEPRRCALLQGVAAHSSRRAAELRDAWSRTGGDYGQTLESGDTHAAVSLLVNHLLGTLEDIRINRLAKPAGLTDTLADPAAVESPYSGGDLADVLATMRGVQAVITGDAEGLQGIGLDDYIASRDVELAARVLRELDNAITLVFGIEPPLSARIAEGSRRDIELLHDGIRQLERTLAAEVAATLAITVTFTDNDGD